MSHGCSFRFSEKDLHLWSRFGRVDLGLDFPSGLTWVQPKLNPPTPLEVGKISSPNNGIQEKQYRHLVRRDPPKLNAEGHNPFFLSTGEHLPLAKMRGT